MVRFLRGTNPTPSFHFRPQIYIEEPQRLSVPISQYKYTKPVTVNRTAEKTWAFRNKDRYVYEVYEKPKRGFVLCRWIKKRQALRRQKNELRKIQRERIAQAQRRREAEFIEQLRKREDYRQEFIKKQPEKVVVQYPKTVQKTVVQTKKKKVRKQKVQKVHRVKATTVKPKAQTKYVTVKKYVNKQSISERFVNCFYRTCCQFFCCLSIILVLGFAIILLI